MRQHHLEHGAEPAGAEECRGLLDVAFHFFKHRLHGAHHEGKPDEDEGQHDAERRVGDLETQLLRDGTDGAVRRVDRGHGNAGNGGGEREGQVHCGVDDAAAGEAVAHQHPGDEQAEDGVDQSRDQRGAEGQAKRRQNARVTRDGEEVGRADRGRPQHQRCERDQYDEAEGGQRETERQPETGKGAWASQGGRQEGHQLVGL